MATFKLTDKKKLIIVSNRVPYNFIKTKTGFFYKKSVSGLTTALDPIMLSNGGLWIGWNGFSKKIHFLDDKVKIEEKDSGNYEIRFVNLNEDDINGFYHGFSNRTLWPLMHGFIFQSYFNNELWIKYQNANKKYARTVLEEIKGSELIWVQDYHLALVPELLRQKNPKLDIIFFLHIPFPNYETFRSLPWHKEILNGLLGCNLLGFQTKNDASNFLLACKHLLGLEVDLKKSSIFYDDRIVYINNFPISIDYNRFANISKSSETNKILQNIRKASSDKRLILSVERLDYTKGIKERLFAVERFFEKYPEFRKKALFIQISAPSRTKIREYINFKNEIDELIGRINGKFAEELWSPINYIYKSLSHEKLTAYYSASDVFLVTPLRDGMNLTAKEYVVCKNDLNGVLILSEFAGCADEFKDFALMVNPYNTEMIADSIYTALNMDLKEKKEKISKLQKIVFENDVYKWCSDFLNYFHQTKTFSLG